MFMYHKIEGSFHCTLYLFMESGIILLEWGRKLERGKKSHGKGLLLGKNSPFNAIPIIGDILQIKLL